MDQEEVDPNVGHEPHTKPPHRKKAPVRTGHQLDRHDASGARLQPDGTVWPPNLSSPYAAAYYTEERPYGEEGVYQRKEGGLDYANQDVLERSHGVASELMKSFGKALFSGKSLVSVSIPCRIFEPRTALQRILDCCGFKTHFLTLAAAQNDPVERMRLVISSIVAGLHLQIKQLKPFNPILGETFQATYPDGSSVHCEQVAHHPPISAFDIQDPRRRWRFWGRHEFTGTMGMNSVTGQQIGPNYVDFEDGTRIGYIYPDCLVDGGVLYGKKRTLTWKGSFQFRDFTNGIAAEINIGNKKGWFSFMSKAERGEGEFDGTIFRYERLPQGLPPSKALIDEVAQREKNGKGGRTLGAIAGDWTQSISFDGRTYWEIGALSPVFPIPLPDEECLPSDARFRADLAALAAGEEKRAQALKTELEIQQRAEKKLRKKGGKDRKKRGR